MDDRLNSMMIWNVADEYLEAAKTLRREKDKLFSPTYFLLGQSIELALKGFLRGLGASEKDLKNLSHDLDKALQEAEKKGLQNLVSLSDNDRGNIALLNVYYQSKDLQYTLSGFKRYPNLDKIFDIAKRLLDGTKNHCIQNRERHFGKSTAGL